MDCRWIVDKTSGCQSLDFVLFAQVNRFYLKIIWLKCLETFCYLFVRKWQRIFFYWIRIFLHLTIWFAFTVQLRIKLTDLQLKLDQIQMLKPEIKSMLRNNQSVLSIFVVVFVDHQHQQIRKECSTKLKRNIRMLAKPIFSQQLITYIYSNCKFVNTFGRFTAM